MSSFAVLVGCSGEPQLTLQVLCDGVPMRALPLVDPATETPNFRFLAPSPGGRLTMRIHNGGIRKIAVFKLERAKLDSQDTWDQLNTNVVNEVNMVSLGNSVTVQRDESTGGRCILVEPLRDALGQVLSETDAQVRGLKRTKWRLGVWPVHGGDKLDSSVWRLLDTKLGLAEMPLYVTSNNGSAILAVSPNVSLDWLKERVEQELGILRADQQMCTEDGSRPGDMSDILSKDCFPTLYVCGQPEDARIWFFVRREKGAVKFVEAEFSDTVAKVRSRFGGSELEAVYLHGKEVSADRRLSECNLASLDTLEIRERGSLRVSVVVEALAPEAPEVVELRVDPGDTVAEVRRRAVFKATTNPQERHRLTSDSVVCLGNEELPGDRSVADCGIATAAATEAVPSLRVTFPGTMTIFIQPLLRKKVALHCLHPDDTVESVKNAIYMVERIPPDEQRLIHAGKQLEELRTLSDCGIGPGTMLHLVFRISGGGCVERLADDDEGARCVSAPAQQPTGVLAVGRIVSGAVVPHELTSKHWLAVNVNGGAPKLQFDVFVEEK